MTLRITLDDLRKTDRQELLSAHKESLSWYLENLPVTTDKREQELLDELRELVRVASGRIKGASSLFSLLALKPGLDALPRVVDLFRSQEVSEQRLEALGECVLDIWEACGDFFQVTGSDLAITERLSVIEESASIRLVNIEGELHKATRAAEAVQGLAERSSIGTYANAFTVDADRQAKGAKRWLIASCILGLSVISVAVLTAFTWQVPAQATAAQIVEHATGRLTILSVLVFALVGSSRNYAARSHHSEAMRFKALTLQTYSGLVVAAEGSGNEGIILERAVDAIFAPVPSGFLPPQPSGTDIIQSVSGLAREFTRPPVKGGSPGT
jgi:hypothetical protein